MPKITPFLWFDGCAEGAANFYASVFENSRVGQILRYGEAGPGPAGSVMTVDFELDGQKFAAVNGGPIFKFTEAVSFVVHCQTRAEVDEYWEKLSDAAKTRRVMAAIMTMTKLDIAGLQQAAAEGQTRT